MASRSNKQAARTYGAPSYTPPQVDTTRPKAGPATPNVRREALNRALKRDERRAPAPRPRVTSTGVTPLGGAGGERDALKVDRAKRDIETRRERTDREIDRQSR